jgi:hypothetical protein
VDHHGYAVPPEGSAAGGEVCGQRDVATEPDDHVGVDVVEYRPGLADCPADPQRQPQQIARQLARQRDGGDQFEVIAAFGNQPGFQSALGAQSGDPHVRVERGQRVGHRHCRFDVPRGATTCEHHRHRVVHP